MRTKKPQALIRKHHTFLLYTLLFLFLLCSNLLTSAPIHKNVRIKNNFNSSFTNTPVAQNINTATKKNTVASIYLVATDMDYDDLTYTLVSAPSNGTLTITGAEATYTPTKDFTGTDTFTYKVTDGTTDSNTATVSISVFDSYLNTALQLGANIVGNNSSLSGSAVSMSSDGNTVAIGAFGNNNSSGLVRVYTYNIIEAKWDQLGLDINGESNFGKFGFSLSLAADGKTIAIGAPDYNYTKGHVRVYTYDITKNDWVQLGLDIDGSGGAKLGTSVSLSSDGKMLVTGAAGGNPNNTGYASVFIYNVSAEIWEQLGNTINGKAKFETFGHSVSIAANKKIIAIGAYNNSSSGGRVSVYNYDEIDDLWLQLGVDIIGQSSGDAFGFSVSLAADGETLAIGAPGNSNNNGIVSIYTYDAIQDSWGLLGANLVGLENEYFGQSVSLTATGRTVAIQSPFYYDDFDGSPKNSIVRIYSYSNVSGWSQVGSNITGTIYSDKSLGPSISIAADGKTIAIGEENDTNGSYTGLVRVFSLVNHNPIANADFASVIENSETTSINVVSNDTDEDNNTLQLTGVTNNTDNSGTVAINTDNQSIDFTPETDFLGIVNITYTISDETATAEGVLTITVTNTNTWTGKTDSNWSKKSNWSTNKSLTSFTSVTIPASGVSYYPSISSSDNVYLKSIIIENEASLFIDNGGSLTLSDNLTNNGSLNLNSYANNFSSLIVGGTASGTVSYKRYLSNEDTWDLIGALFSDVSISNFQQTNSSAIATNPNDANTYAIGTYDNTTDSWSNYTSSTIGAAGNFISGKGYQMATSNFYGDPADPFGGGTVLFTGTVPTTDVTIAIQNNDAANSGSGRRWNLIANPYPSYLNGNNVVDATNNFLTINTAVLDDNYEAIYGYNGTDYTVYNHTYNDNTAVYIAPGQGFFVAAASTSAANIHFTEAMQTVSGTDDFIAKTTSSSHECIVSASIDNVEQVSTRLYFQEGLHTGLDPGYDAGAFNQQTLIATRFVTEDTGVNFAINAMGLSSLVDTVIPVSIYSEKDKELTLQIQANTLPAGTYVYLKDNQLQTIHDLTASSFSVTPTETLEGTGRFFLHLRSSALSTLDYSQSNLPISVYKTPSNSTITIEGLQEATTFSIYNLLGAKVHRELLNATPKQYIEVSHLQTGVYIIQMNNSSQQITKKLFID